MAYLSYHNQYYQFGWEYEKYVTNFDYLNNAISHFKRDKHWNTVPRTGWTRLAPKLLIVWEN